MPDLLRQLYSDLQSPEECPSPCKVQDRLFRLPGNRSAPAAPWAQSQRLALHLQRGRD
jgi:hypothetical protein